MHSASVRWRSLVLRSDHDAQCFDHIANQTNGCWRQRNWYQYYTKQGKVLMKSDLRKQTFMCFANALRVDVTHKFALVNRTTGRCEYAQRVGITIKKIKLMIQCVATAVM